MTPARTRKIASAYLSSYSLRMRTMQKAHGCRDGFAAWNGMTRTGMPYRTSTTEVAGQVHWLTRSQQSQNVPARHASSMQSLSG